MTNVTRRTFTAITGGALALTLTMGTAIAQNSEPLRIAYAAVGSFQPFFIAERMGWFAEAGLTVELTPGGAPQENMARLMSGEVHIAGSGSTPAIAAVANGAPVRIVFANQNIGEVPTTGLIVRADSPYQSVADLAGQTVGVQGLQGTGALMINRSLRDAGLQPGAVTLTHMPPDTHVDNLRNGNVEGVVTFALFYELAARNPDFRVIEAAYETVRGAPGIVYTSSNRTLAERGDDIATLIEVLDRASRYANENPDDVRAIDRERTRLPPAYLDSRTITPASVTLDVAALAALAEDMHAFGWINRVPSVDEILWERMPRD